MFEKGLTDLIRGIRHHADNETQYVSQCMDECRKELRTDSVEMKANAVAKLTYIQMLGYDVSWAAFNMVEVMSSKKFSHKRIGYLAGSQCFHKGTDVLMLTTNMIKKDLSSQNQYEAGLALNGLANFITPDLARDLANDIVSMMASVRPYVRKKATLITYKIFLKFPDALRPTFPRLKDKLEDSDPSVQSCAVNVVCELARKNPKNYLSLAPIFFKLLTASTNNWMRIKIIKLFAALTPLEPRLAKKLIEPLTGLIQDTPAMSLLHECIMTLLTGMPDHMPSIQLCVQKLLIFIEDTDQNLKYLGLQAMAKVLKIQPKAVSPHKDLIIDCLTDQDESIRLRALDLLAGMVNKKNLVDIVRKLLQHLDQSDGTHYRDEVVQKVIEICSQGHYQFITNFEWYLQVLIQLTRVEGTKHGKLIASQLLDVSIRVKSVRSSATKQLAALLGNSHIARASNQKNGIVEVLYAAAWVTGEFSSELTEIQPVLESLVQPRVASLPGHIQAVYVHNTIKLYAAAVKKGASEEELTTLRDIIIQRMPLFVQSGDLEVQERAVTVLELMKYVTKKRDTINLDSEILQLFDGELKPVAAKAQKKVPIPDGLDLDKWINDPPEDKEEDQGFGDITFFGIGDTDDYSMPSSGIDLEYKPQDSDDEDTKRAKREARLQMQEANPFHLGGANAPLTSKQSSLETFDVEEIPTVNLDVDMPITFDVPDPTQRKKKKKLSKKERKRLKKLGIKPPEEDEGPVIEIQTVSEMPEGAEETDDEDLDVNDPHAALNVDLEAPLNESEFIPVATHHVVSETSPDKGSSKKKKKKDKKKKKKKTEGDDTHEHVHEEGSLLDLGDEPAAEEPVAAAPAPEASALDSWLDDKPAEEPSSSGKKKKKKKKKKKGEAEEDVHIEIETGEEEPGMAAAPEPAAPAAAAEPESSSSSSKKKKKKKDKKSKKSKTAATSDLLADLSVVAPVITHRALIKDDNIALTYDSMAQPESGSNQVCYSLLVTNLSSLPVTKMELSLLDSLNSKVVRSEEDAPIAIEFELTPGQTNEVKFSIDSQATGTPAKLRGSLTFMVGNPGEVKQHVLDFELPLHCSSFVAATTCTSDEFAALLSGGTLCALQSLEIETAGQSFQDSVMAICRALHLTIVEAAPDQASLYGTSTGDKKSVCLLIKKGEGKASVNGKCTDGPFLEQLIAEIKAAFQG